MSNEAKYIDIKNCAYYFFQHFHYFQYDIINIKDFDPNNIKIDEKSYSGLFYLTR